MIKKENKPKLEGIDGWLYLYFLFLVYLVFSLFGILVGTYDSLVSGSGGIETVFFFLTAIVSIIVTAVSLDLIFYKKKSAKLWSIVSLVVCFILFVGLLISSLGNEELNYEIQFILILIVGSLVWIFYFLQSERVKNTFIK
mgnify:CR=1 FL=1